MQTSVTTIERFIFDQEHRYPEATGELSTLLYDIALAAKIIAALFAFWLSLRQTTALNAAAPQYPAALRSQGVSGRVIAQFVDQATSMLAEGAHPASVEQATTQAGFPVAWRNILTCEEPASLDLADIFRSVPLAVLEPA